MATPQQRPDPNNEPLRDTRQVGREVGGGVRWGWTWIWVWLLILAFIVAIAWFGGWGWAGYGGWWWGNRNAQIVQPATTQLMGSGVAVLNATNKQPFVGRPFNVTNVPVQNIVNDHAFWIGTRNIAPMLVVLEGANNTTANANIAQGDHINIVGTVEKAPPAAQAKQQWSLNDDQARQLEQQGAYIQASEVEAAQATQP